MFGATGTYDIVVATGTGESVNWASDAPVSEGSGAWRTSRSSHAGFVLVSLINGIEAGTLSWGNNNNPALGVGGRDSFGFSAAINTTEDRGTVEGIRLELPARNAPVGVQGDRHRKFSGLTGMSFSRLTQHNGSIIAIRGFTANPEASWVVNPVNTPMRYDSATGTLLIVTTSSLEEFGTLRFGNPDATLSANGVSLTISNERAKSHNRGGFGLVGWQYQATR